MEAAFSPIEIKPHKATHLRLVTAIPKPNVTYERDPDSNTYGFRDVCIGRRIALAQKMARKREQARQNSLHAKEFQDQRALHDAKIQGLAKLAGERAIVTFVDGNEQDLFIAGMAEYTGKVRPNYNSNVSIAPCMHPETINNQVVCRSPDDLGQFFHVSPDYIASFRLRTEEDMPLLWQGDNS